MPIISALVRQKQEDHQKFKTRLVFLSDFQANQSYIVRTHLKYKTNIEFLPKDKNSVFV